MYVFFIKYFKNIQFQRPIKRNYLFNQRDASERLTTFCNLEFRITG